MRADRHLVANLTNPGPSGTGADGKALQSSALGKKLKNSKKLKRTTKNSVKKNEEKLKKLGKANGADEKASQGFALGFPQVFCWVSRGYFGFPCVFAGLP